MYHRNLGNTELRVSEVGMGCNRIGDRNQTDNYWISLIQTAVDTGVNIFDTSERYAQGRSEEMLGIALQGKQDVYIATKVSGGFG